MQKNLNLFRLFPVFVILFVIIIMTMDISNVSAETRSDSLLDVNIDWASFLERCDPVWDIPPIYFSQAALLGGNGELGMYVYKESAEMEHPHPDIKEISPSNRVLRFGVDRVDVYDRRDVSWGWTAYSRPRFHVGNFQLYTVGQITSLNMRQDLYNAELRGAITTENGEIMFRAFVHASMPLMVLELETSDSEQECKWVFRPGKERRQ